MWPSKSRRSDRLPHSEERVVIIGASSGIGRALAHKYASAGARLCIVARREAELAKVGDECQALAAQSRRLSTGEGTTRHHIVTVQADFTTIDDMLTLRQRVKEVWDGLDTLLVCAGVATLRPVFELADVEVRGNVYTPSEATKAGIEHAIAVANSVAQVNYIGPLVVALTFIPLLSRSPSPSVMLMSTLGAIIPAPTMALYSASKSASLLLYQALAIEHPNIAFTLVIPSTVRGEAFFAAAADGGSIRPGAADPNQYGTTQEAVAARTFTAVDKGEHTVLIPSWPAHFAHFLSWIAPSVVSRFARRRYNFPVD
ncbi:NAD-P-binding protein [Trametes elegans]|nr:NAD-P-binding protein [Trametes elegans]